MSMTAHRSAPCSTRSRVQLLRSRVTGRTTKTASPALSPSAIPRLGSLYRRARARCRARRPKPRDRHLQLIAEKGRMGWQKASGYNRRALAEATIGRFKRVIGDGLRARTDERQATEMNVAVAVLNRMLEFRSEERR